MTVCQTIACKHGDWSGPSPMGHSCSFCVCWSCKQSRGEGTRRHTPSYPEPKNREHWERAGTPPTAETWRSTPPSSSCHGRRGYWALCSVIMGAGHRYLECTGCLLPCRAVAKSEDQGLPFTKWFIELLEPCSHWTGWTWDNMGLPGDWGDLCELPPVMSTCTRSHHCASWCLCFDVSSVKGSDAIFSRPAPGSWPRIPYSKWCLEASGWRSQELGVSLLLPQSQPAISTAITPKYQCLSDLLQVVQGRTKGALWRPQKLQSGTPYKIKQLCFPKIVFTSL